MAGREREEKENHENKISICFSKEKEIWLNSECFQDFSFFCIKEKYIFSVKNINFILLHSHRLERKLNHCQLEISNTLRGTSLNVYEKYIF